MTCESSVNLLSRAAEEATIQECRLITAAQVPELLVLKLPHTFPLEVREDSSQEAILKAVKKEKKSDTVAIPQPYRWLRVVSYRDACTDRRREGARRQRENLHCESLAREMSTPDRDLQMQEEISRVWQTTGQLRGLQQTVLLQHLRGESAKEISKAVGRSRRYVNFLISQAKSRIREVLRQNE